MNPSDITDWVVMFVFGTAALFLLKLIPQLYLASKAEGYSDLADAVLNDAPIHHNILADNSCVCDECRNKTAIPDFTTHTPEAYIWK